MNKLQALALQEYITRQIEEYEQEDLISYTLLEALGLEGDLVEQVLDLLDKQAYIQPDELTLSVRSIDELLEFAEFKGLSLEHGIGSILESYVMSELSLILELDLLEWV